jgi:hypothetical protein
LINDYADMLQAGFVVTDAVPEALQSAAAKPVRKMLAVLSDRKEMFSVLWEIGNTPHPPPHPPPRMG